MKTLFIIDHLVEPSLGSASLELILGLFPKADIATLVYLPEAVGSRIRYHRVQVLMPKTNLSSVKSCINYLPILPGVWKQLKVDDYQLVIVINQGLFFKTMKPGAGKWIIYHVGMLEFFLEKLKSWQKIFFSTYLRKQYINFYRDEDLHLSIDMRFCPFKSEQLNPFIHPTNELPKNLGSGSDIFMYRDDPWSSKVDGDLNIHWIDPLTVLNNEQLLKCHIFISSHFACFFDVNLLQAMLIGSLILIDENHPLASWINPVPGIVLTSDLNWRSDLEKLMENQHKIDRRAIRREALKLNGRLWRRKFLKILGKHDIYPEV